MAVNFAWPSTLGILAGGLRHFCLVGSSSRITSWLIDWLNNLIMRVRGCAFGIREGINDVVDSKWCAQALGKELCRFATRDYPYLFGFRLQRGTKSCRTLGESVCPYIFLYVHMSVHTPPPKKKTRLASGRPLIASGWPEPASEHPPF